MRASQCSLIVPAVEDHLVGSFVVLGENREAVAKTVRWMSATAATMVVAGSWKPAIILIIKSNYFGERISPGWKDQVDQPLGLHPGYLLTSRGQYATKGRNPPP